MSPLLHASLRKQTFKHHLHLSNDKVWFAEHSKSISSHAPLGLFPTQLPEETFKTKNKVTEYPSLKPSNGLPQQLNENSNS